MRYIIMSNFHIHKSTRQTNFMTTNVRRTIKYT